MTLRFWIRPKKLFYILSKPFPTKKNLAWIAKSSWHYTAMHQNNSKHPSIPMAQQVGSMSVFMTRCTNNLLPLPNITIICQASTAQILRNIWHTSLSLCILSSQHKFYLEIFLSSRSFFITHRAAVAKACNSSKVAAGPVKVVVPGGACGWNIVKHRRKSASLHMGVWKVGHFCETYIEITITSWYMWNGILWFHPQTWMLMLLI